MPPKPLTYREVKRKLEVTGFILGVGGNRHVGRRLWRLLGAAAFELLLKSGAVTEEDVETMHRAHIEFESSRDKYALFILLMACGQKSAHDRQKDPIS